MQEKKTSTPNDSVHQRLLRSASTVFARKGYAAASVNSIVELTGVTKPVLYYHFGSKEGIFLALMNQAQHGLLEALLPSGEEDDPLRRLRRLCTRILDLSADNLDFIRLINTILNGPPQGAPPFDFEAFHTPLFQAIQSHLEEAAARGLLRDGRVKDQAWLVYGTLCCCLDAQVCLPDSAPGREGLQRMMKMIFRGIASEKYWQELPAGDGPASRSRAARPKSTLSGLKTKRKSYV